MRIRALACVSALVALAGSAMAAEPKPPVSLDAKGIDAWYRAYVTPNGWVLVHADGAALTLALPTINRTEAGLLQADIRREYYRPNKLGQMNSRSNRQSWMVDCAGRRFQVVSMDVFLNNNLQGDTFRRQDFDSEWTGAQAGTPDGEVFDRICAAGPAKK